MSIFQIINKYIIIFSIVLGGIFLFSCNEKKTDNQPNTVQDTIQKPKIDTFPTIKFHTIEFKSNSERKEFFQQLMQKPNFSINVMKLLNRKEWSLVQSSNVVIYPDTFISDLRAYSFFPVYYPEVENIPKIIFVSAKYQAA
ncbi:MAG TPA: hypothetical protein P5216_04260, partial [Bacteroidota bacterium]|nr:hypothetical protein [Bacteroidota bacterium]